MGKANLSRKSTQVIQRGNSNGLVSLSKAGRRVKREQGRLKEYDPSEHMKALWADPAYRANMIKKFNTPECKAKHSILSKENWKNPKIRKIMTDKITEIANTSESKEDVSKRTIDLWKSDEYRDKLKKKLSSPEVQTKIQNNEIRKKKMSDSAKKMWENPNYCALKAEQARNQERHPHTEETKLKISKSNKGHIHTEETREKIRQSKLKYSAMRKESPSF